MKSRFRGAMRIPGRTNGRVRRHADRWASIREQSIRETGDYLTACLDHPELAVAIPTAPAAQARFPRELADHFWAQVLSAS